MAVLTLIDQYTGENVNYEEVSYWYDGSSMDRNKVDDVIYIFNNNKYYKRVIPCCFLRPEWFGAKGNRINDDRDSLQKSFLWGSRLHMKVKLSNARYLVNSYGTSKIKHHSGILELLTDLHINF